MSILKKIAEFRYAELKKSKPHKDIIMLLSKSECLELLDFIVSKGIESLTKPSLHEVNNLAIAEAKAGSYKLLHEQIKGIDTVYGISIHPDWNEFTQSKVYY